MTTALLVVAALVALWIQWAIIESAVFHAIERARRRGRRPRGGSVRDNDGDWSPLAKALAVVAILIGLAIVLFFAIRPMR